ncbi:MAG: right-handed parallel beta-helix repeat-containing protein [Candidatus Thermoplasmatota archaeon]|nr:right-handed parallel beta-helix repeat-containing protein [Candidatus Thermoplasmatota archaeon]
MDIDEHRHRIITFILVLTIISALALININTEIASASTITVPDQYSKIKYAVENATAGDTILVDPGEYEEEVIVTKPLTIKSTAGPGSTVVKNVGYTVFRLDSNNVEISGFTIRDAQNGIFIKEYDECNIENNIITRNYRGIIIYGKYNNLATDHTIQNNNITDNDETGISLGGYGAYCTVSNNVMTKNDASGITVGSEYNIIENNTVHSNVDNGIYLIGSGHSTIRNNKIYNNEIYGIHSLYSYNNKFRDNIMHDNDYNFRIVGDLPLSQDYIHDIDTSNLIEGKPMYYWVGESNKEIPSNAGFVALIDCNNILVSDVNISKTGSGILLVSTNQSTIDDVEVRDNFHGILALYSNYNTIKNVYGTHNYDAAIRIEYSRENNIFMNNLTDNSYTYGDGLDLSNCNNHTIVNNTINNNGGSGINIILSEHCNVLSNTAKYNRKGYGVYVGSNSHYNNINDNILIGNDISNLALSASQYNHMINNILESSSDGSGVRLDYSSFNLIDSNTIDDNDVFGVYLDNSDFNNVTNNNIESNYARGVYIRNSDRNRIQSNYISDNREGIRLEGSSEYNDIRNNTILNSEWYGMYLFGGNNNDIYKNTVYKSEEYYGIYLKESNDNKIYWNDFIDNEQDCFDDSNNNWSLPYPDGGNYWSNYSGVDDMSGSNQDQPGSDGLGDFPYSIPGGNNEDKYPFMEPIEGIGNTKPKASFTVDPYTGDLSTVFIFDPSSSSDNEDNTMDLLMRWDWEDDSTYDTPWLTNLSVTKTFDEYGTYKVKLQVKDTGGLTDSVVQSVYVYGLPSVPQNFQVRPSDGAVLLSWDELEDDGGSDIESYAIYKGTQGQSVQFYKQVDESTFSYRDTQVTNGVTYYYKISGVSGRGEGNLSDALSATPEDGLSPYIPPEASFTHHIIYPIVDYGYRINLVDNSSKGEGEIVNYSWNISNDVDILRYGRTVETSLKFGVYSVEITVLDDNGRSDTEVRELDLSKPKPPTADFTWNPFYPKEHDMVWMVDKSIPGDNNIINWTYEFNDGEFYLYGGGWFGASPGVYSVNLTVSDRYLTDSITKEIVIPYDISFDVTPGQVHMLHDNQTFVSIDVDNQAELEISYFPGNPTNGTDFEDNIIVGDFIGIEVDNSSSVNWPITIRIYYENEEINELNVDENTLEIYYWDEENQEWSQVEEECSVNTTNQNGYSGYVECELDHLTIFTLSGMNPPPYAICSENISCRIGELVTFDGTSSTDDIGIKNYTWEFEYDGKIQKLYGGVSEFVFEKEGTYEIKLTVTDGHNNTSSDTFYVYVGEEEKLPFCYIIIIGVIAIGVLTVAFIVRNKRIR